MKDNPKALLQLLSRSDIYKDYERAFSEATGLPIALRPVETWQANLHGKSHENPFCALMADSSRTCAACLEVQQKISDSKLNDMKTVTCFAGLCDTTIPVHVGQDLLGFLQTGQIAFKQPTKVQFNRISKQLIDWGVKIDLKRLEDAYFHTRVLSRKQYQAMLHLLETFAKHLSMVANQVAMQQRDAEPVMIQRAREFIIENKSKDLSLAEVAKAVNVSVFYFCKMFKKATGINFTEYLSRVRIEKAKNLLLNPNLRISEIAYDVGFQSLTHFNRVFRKMVGESPTDYRKTLPKARD
jgi:AraC-like DNA-binding protein